jgi:hypothetical protein
MQTRVEAFAIHRGQIPCDALRSMRGGVRNRKTNPGKTDI